MRLKTGNGEHVESWGGEVDSVQEPDTFIIGDEVVRVVSIDQIEESIERTIGGSTRKPVIETCDHVLACDLLFKRDLLGMEEQGKWSDEGR